jgi:hypothetical protein
MHITKSNTVNRLSNICESDSGENWSDVHARSGSVRHLVQICPDRERAGGARTFYTPQTHIVIQLSLSCLSLDMFANNIGTFFRQKLFSSRQHHCRFPLDFLLRLGPGKTCERLDWIDNWRGYLFISIFMIVMLSMWVCYFSKSDPIIFQFVSQWHHWPFLMSLDSYRPDLVSPLSVFWIPKAVCLLTPWIVNFLPNCIVHLFWCHWIPIGEAWQIRFQCFFLTQAVFIDSIVSQPSNWLGRSRLPENTHFISGNKSHEANIWHSEPLRRSAMSSILWLLFSGFGQVLLMSRLERFIQDTFVCLSLRVWSHLFELSKLPEILLSFFHFVIDVKSLVILIDRRFRLGRILLNHEITYKYWRVI